MTADSLSEDNLVLYYKNDDEEVQKITEALINSDSPNQVLLPSGVNTLYGDLFSLTDDFFELRDLTLSISQGANPVAQVDVRIISDEKSTEPIQVINFLSQTILI